VVERRYLSEASMADSDRPHPRCRPPHPTTSDSRAEPTYHQPPAEDHFSTAKRGVIYLGRARAKGMDHARDVFVRMRALDGQQDAVRELLLPNVACSNDAKVLAEVDDADVMLYTPLAWPLTVVIESSNSDLRLWFQRVPEPKSVKNRVHLDLRCADADTQASRLVALGDCLGEEQPNEQLIVLQDPEGNEFCLLRD